MKHYLHIGVFRGGRLVDDRYVAEKGEVTVGRSAGNTFGLVGSNLPEEHVLFTFDRRVPSLNVIPGMKGEIALDGKTKTSLEDLKSKGQASGNGWTLGLPESARGWVSLSDTAFFIQVTPKPPPPPKSTLPPSARTGFFSGMERTFVTCFAVTFLIESTIVIAVNSRKHIEAEPQLEAEDLDRFAEIIMPEKKPDPPKEEKKPDEEKKQEEDKPKEAKEDKPDKTPEQKQAAHDDKVKKAVASSALLRVLGSAGGSGSIADVFKNSGFNSDISDALNGANGVKLATDDNGPEHKGSAGGDGAVGIGDLGASAGGGGGHATLGEKRAPKPQISVDESDVDVDSSSVDKDALGKFIRVRLNSIKGCYERELKLNPSLKGKIVVRFTVTTAGGVGDCSIDNDTMHDDNVSSCIVRLIKSWKFPFKPDSDVPVSFPFVFQPGG